MSPKPIWLLDFDGVINAVTKKPDKSIYKDWNHTTIPAHGNEWPIWYSDTVINTLAEAATANIDIVWLSTWREHTAAIHEHIPTLPTFDYLSEDKDGTDYHHFGDWWKLAIARKVVAEGRPLLWTDDDLSFERGAQTWLETRTGGNVIVSPSPHTGMVPKHLKKIREFLDVFAS